MGKCWLSWSQYDQKKKNKKLGEFISIHRNQLYHSAPPEATFGHINKITEFRLKPKNKIKHSPTATSFCGIGLQHHMQLRMPCFKKKSDKPDFMLSTVTLIATKHSIREMTGRSGEQKRKRRQDSCEYLEVCHEGRVDVLVLL